MPWVVRIHHRPRTELVQTLEEVLAFLDRVGGDVEGEDRDRGVVVVTDRPIGIVIGERVLKVLELGTEHINNGVSTTILINIDLLVGSSFEGKRSGNQHGGRGVVNGIRFIQVRIQIHGVVVVNQRHII